MKFNFFKNKVSEVYLFIINLLYKYFPYLVYFLEI